MKRFLLLILFFLSGVSFALQVADFSQDGTTVLIDAVPEKVDVARDFYVTVTIKTPKGIPAVNPDLRDRFQGFQIAEDFAEEPVVDKDGETTSVTRWRLVPEPAAKKYCLAPFVVNTFYTKSVLFEPPSKRETVTGEMEVNPKKDLPPLSWKLVGLIVAFLAGLVLIVATIWFVVRKIKEMVRIHRMSPIERAYHELGILLKKGLPGRGFFKDFYVELTMVVRRYIERRHGVKAPNLTTDEFLRAAQDSSAFTEDVVEQLKKFLESADLVKFAGVQATPLMADDATQRARNYLDTDSKIKDASERKVQS
jgi:hypothetical protein